MRGGLAEGGFFQVGREFQAALEGEERRLGIFQPQVADAQAEVRVAVLRVELGGLVEGFRRLVPRAQPLQARRPG